MSESTAQSLADAYWPEVRKWAIAHPHSNPFRSGHVHCWLVEEAERAGLADHSGMWHPADVANRAEEILRERVRGLREGI